MLFFQLSSAQYHFNDADVWLKDNIQSLGGRAVLVILKNGKIIYNHSENDLTTREKAGYSKIAVKHYQNTSIALQDFTFTTREPIASCSKWLTAALVMTFVDNGKLNLEDTIGKFFPVFTQYHKGNITIADCLSHLTAIKGGGLTEFRKLLSESNSMNEVMNKIALLPMEGEPGKLFHYSSIGPQIAAAVIEKISGRNFNTLFQTRIANPCDMKHTDFGKAKIPLAAGGAKSTPEDYIHFLQMILQNGNYNGKTVLSKGSVIKMQKDYTKNAIKMFSPEQAQSLSYGLGEWIFEEGNDRANVVSSPGLFGSFPWVDNKNQYAGFLFVLNLNRKEREQKYNELRKIIDVAISK